MSGMDYNYVRITIEALSAIACFVLLKFMIKPYQLKKQSRYLGLPIGFGILGFNFALTVMLLTPPLWHNAALSWFAHFTRVFAFVFLAVTYYFSKKSEKRLLWGLTLSLLIVAFVASALILIYTPQGALSQYAVALTFIRILSILVLTYIIIHTFRIHLANPKQTPFWIPLGFLFFALSQFLLLTIILLRGSFASSYTDILGWGGLAARLVGLAIFLFVAYRIFYSSEGMGHKR